MNKSISSIILFIFLISCNSQKEIVPESEPENVTEITKLIDGPYVLLKSTGIVSYSIDNMGELKSESVFYDNAIEVIAPYRTPEAFEIKLTEELPKTPVEIDDGQDILAVSDIEGNYYALTKLLIGNGVVDNNLNWAYGKNHLVFNGDMVDRGDYVTQVLWLMYKLDIEAEKAGGHVHYIIGNHDVMCMTGDDRYARDKYIDMAQKLNIEYKELYGEKSEIGRWMHSKNSIEKINGYIFVHGGISPDILQLDLSLTEINNLVKPYYNAKIDDSTPDDVYKLFKTSGVFWYRGYVKAREGRYDKATIEDINNTLSYYSANSIVVGHCLVDEIGTIYGERVVTMDVHNPDGESSNLEFQALLIENDKLYRVDEKGQKVSL